MERGAKTDVSRCDDRLGIAYDNLSTPEGPFGAAYYRRPISNEFESAGVLDYRGLIEEAKKADTIFFATSGTAAAKIRKVFIDDFRFKFMGEISIPDPVKTEALKSGADWMDVKGTMDFLRSGKNGNNIVFKFAHTLEEGDALVKAFSKVTDPSRLSVLVRPGSALEELERYSQQVKGEKNLAAFERGDAEIVIIVGWAGLRGLEANLKQYGGRQSRMDILDPQKLPTEELTQLIGRLAEGRAGMLEKRYFRALIRPEALKGSETLPEAAMEVISRLRAVAQNGEVTAARSLIASGDLPKSRTYTAREIIDAVARHDAALERYDGKVDKSGPPNPLWDEVLLPTIKNPNNLRAAEYLSEISEILKLRDAFTPAERDALLKLDLKQAGAELRRQILEQPEVRERRKLLEVLTAAMGRREQDNAISSSGILRGVRTSPEPAAP